MENNWVEEMQRCQRKRRWTRREKKQNCQWFNQPSYQTPFPLRTRKERSEEETLGEEEKRMTQKGKKGREVRKDKMKEEERANTKQKETDKMKKERN